MAIGASWSFASRATTRSSASPEISGSSPCRLTIMPGSFEARGDFGHAVGAGRMVGAGHHDLAAKAGHGSRDPLVVGRHDDPL